MDKTYAAVTGNVVTDWPLVIERLDTMSDEEHVRYADLAWEWPTCAVGNSCAIIPRYESDGILTSLGAPKDDELLRLGKSFAHHIEDRKQSAALTCWQAIEARATELVAQELAKRNATASPSLPMLVPFVAREGFRHIKTP